jgi:hypothetical protein
MRDGIVCRNGSISLEVFNGCFTIGIKDEYYFSVQQFVDLLNSLEARRAYENSLTPIPGIDNLPSRKTPWLLKAT